MKAAIELLRYTSDMVILYIDDRHTVSRVLPNVLLEQFKIGSTQNRDSLIVVEPLSTFLSIPFRVNHFLQQD